MPLTRLFQRPAKAARAPETPAADRSAAAPARVRKPPSGGWRARIPRLGPIGAGGRGALCGPLLALALAAPAPAEGPDVGGPFDLPASTGGRFGSADLAGRPYALFFGFTQCPEVCPMTLAALSAAFEDLGPAARDLAAVFVTVDPDRDSPAWLSDYLRAFDPRIIGLSGTAEETLAIAQAFRATYRKVPLGDTGDYSMDHTAVVYLMGRDGRFVDVVAYGAPAEDLAAALRRLVEAGA